MLILGMVALSVLAIVVGTVWQVEVWRNGNRQSE